MIRRACFINTLIARVAGLLHVHVHRPQAEDNIRLRPVRISDASFMHSGFVSDNFLVANCLTRPITSSRFLTWLWIKRSFAYSYCILADGERAGFLGLHSLQPCATAEISLALFKEDMRRKGYGRRAFQIFADEFEKHNFVKKIVVRVARDNFIYLSFWRTLGFKEIHREHSVRTLLYSKKQRVVE